MIRKLSKLAIFELVFGLLPATIVFSPFAIFLILSGPLSFCSNQQFDIFIPLSATLLGLCALSGLIALWCAFLFKNSFVEVRTKLKFAITNGLISGLIATLLGLGLLIMSSQTMPTGVSEFDHPNLSIFYYLYLLLVWPLIISFRYIVRQWRKR